MTDRIKQSVHFCVLATAFFTLLSMWIWGLYLIVNNTETGFTGVPLCLLFSGIMAFISHLALNAIMDWEV